MLETICSMNLGSKLIISGLFLDILGVVLSLKFFLLMTNEYIAEEGRNSEESSWAGEEKSQQEYMNTPTGKSLRNQRKISWAAMISLVLGFILQGVGTFLTATP